jgi:hypothetical protein
MEIVAQVFEWMITKTELDFEENIVRKQFPEVEKSEIRRYAISKLIDRYLLMQEALNHGINIDDDEFEDAMLDMMDAIEYPETSPLVDRRGREQQIERVIKSNSIIRKYIDSIHLNPEELEDEKLFQFYQERKEYFCHAKEVRASHILVKGNDEAALRRITEIRNLINSPEDFTKNCVCNSECPSGINCGDLGFFPKGRMIPEIERIAFSMKVNEISQPFLTKYGYHILMVTDRREKTAIPFEEIKDCLKESLLNMEREVTLARILSEAHVRAKDSVKIFEHAFE